MKEYIITVMIVHEDTDGFGDVDFLTERFKDESAARAWERWVVRTVEKTGVAQAVSNRTIDGSKEEE